MIKFFRKIRQRFLTENKFSKYLIYAIGEIVLVVIGILIALQINNWNESRKNKHYEIEYLLGIESNLNQDIRELEMHFSNDTIRLDAYTDLIRAFNADDITSKHEEIIANIYATIGYNWFEGQNVVFEDIKSSGNINLIRSNSVRLGIQKYYRFFEEVLKREALHNSEIQKFADRNSLLARPSTFLEPTYQDQWKRWNGNVGAPDLSFLEKPDAEIIKAKLVDNWSQMKGNQFLNYSSRTELYNKAIDLKRMINQYLSRKK